MRYFRLVALLMVLLPLVVPAGSVVAGTETWGFSTDAGGWYGVPEVGSASLDWVSDAASPSFTDGALALYGVKSSGNATVLGGFQYDLAEPALVTSGDNFAFWVSAYGDCLGGGVVAYYQDGTYSQNTWSDFGFQSYVTHNLGVVFDAGKYLVRLSVRGYSGSSCQSGDVSIEWDDFSLVLGGSSATFTPSPTPTYTPEFTPTPHYIYSGGCVTPTPTLAATLTPLATQWTGRTPTPTSTLTPMPTWTPFLTPTPFSVSFVGTRYTFGSGPDPWIVGSWRGNDIHSTFISNVSADPQGGSLRLGGAPFDTNTNANSRAILVVNGGFREGYWVRGFAWVQSDPNSGGVGLRLDVWKYDSGLGESVFDHSLSSDAAVIDFSGPRDGWGWHEFLIGPSVSFTDTEAISLTLVRGKDFAADEWDSLYLYLDDLQVVSGSAPGVPVCGGSPGPEPTLPIYDTPVSECLGDNQTCVEIEQPEALVCFGLQRLEMNGIGRIPGVKVCFRRYVLTRLQVGGFNMDVVVNAILVGVPALYLVAALRGSR